MFIFLSLQALITFKNYQVLGISIGLQASKIIELTNQARNQNNLPDLHTNEKLNQAALDKASDMFQQGYWDHYSPNQKPPWEFILASGYNYRHAGENLGKDFIDEQTLLNAWLESPAHRANILSDKYQDIGVAVVKEKLNNQDAILIVQMFGSQFTPSEIANLEEAGYNFNSEIQTNSHEIIENKTKFNLKNLWMDKFMMSKLLAALVVFGLITILSIDILKSVASRQFGKRAKKYWGNLIFLLILGTIILFTQKV